MKTYPLEQQIKYLRLKTDIEALLLELQDQSQRAQNNHAVSNQTQILQGDVYWNAA